jgi:hypothetical protein
MQSELISAEMLQQQARSKTNDRYVNMTFSELQEANRNPIFGYEDSPLLPLENTLEKLVSAIPHAMDYVKKAIATCNRNSDLLTRDESAAIYLYTMPSPVFSRLNDALRDENRDALKPWFAFLKLFITALKNLPSIKETVWRGIDCDDTLSFVDDNVQIWWSVNSCSKAVDIIGPFLGDRGTLFAVNAVNGKDISTFSANPDEKEVVLMPGTRVRRICEFALSLSDRFFVLHLEEINSLG